MRQVLSSWPGQIRRAATSAPPRRQSAVSPLIRGRSQRSRRGRPPITALSGRGSPSLWTPVAAVRPPYFHLGAGFRPSGRGTSLCAVHSFLPCGTPGQALRVRRIRQGTPVTPHTLIERRLVGTG